MAANHPPHPTDPQDSCDRLDACVAYNYGAVLGVCRTYGMGLLKDGTLPGWSYFPGNGGTDVITMTSGITVWRCHRKRRPGGAWCTYTAAHPPVEHNIAFSQPATTTGATACEHPSCSRTFSRAQPTPRLVFSQHGCGVAAVAEMMADTRTMCTTCVVRALQPQQSPLQRPSPRQPSSTRTPQTPTVRVQHC